MDVLHRPLHRLLKIGTGFFLAAGLILTLSACSDDPILGPNEGEPDDSGGSYSSINRLAPTDSTASQPQTANPERF